MHVEARWPHGSYAQLRIGPGSSPGRGHCVVFLGKTLYSHSASPPRCINGYRRRRDRVKEQKLNIFGENCCWKLLMEKLGEHLICICLE